MKTTSIKVNRENKNVEIVVSNQIPFIGFEGAGSLDSVRDTSYNMNLLKIFKDSIIASLQRRMNACIKNLQNHVDDIVYCDEVGSIIYKRKDGSFGRFNLPSYTCMEDCISALRQSNYKVVLDSPGKIDQILKAFLNDTEQNHSDEDCFKWSDLVSMLCEKHIY